MLFELTPAEWWVWSYLVLLAREQGDSHIVIPRPGEDPRLERRMCRKNFKRVLHVLRKKMGITRLVIPASKNHRLEVYLQVSLLGDENVPQNIQGYKNVPQKGVLGDENIPQNGVGGQKSPPNGAGGARVCHNLTDLQAKLNSFKARKAKQGEIMEMVLGLSEVEVRRCRGLMFQENKKSVRARVNEKAKLYAEVRYYLDHDMVRKPQAWLDTLAREAEVEMQGGGGGGGAGAAVGLLLGRGR